MLLLVHWQDAGAGKSCSCHAGVTGAALYIQVGQAGCITGAHRVLMCTHTMVVLKAISC